MLKRTSTLLIALLVVGCLQTTTTIGPFETALRVAPDQIRGGDGFWVTLSITNRHTSPLALTSPNGCVTSLAVRRSGQVLHLSGSEFGCPAGATSFEFGPEETRTFVYGLSATLEGGDDEKVAPPGKYEVTADIHLSLPPVSESFVIAEAPPVKEPERTFPN